MKRGPSLLKPTGEYQFQLSRTIDYNIFGFILIAMRMPANDNWIRPTGHKTWNIFA